MEWNLRHYSPRVRAFSNTATPTLPLPDAGFDLVLAFSVFTHIAAPETQWLAELRRILRPGGVAYLTIHDESTWAQSPELRAQAARDGGLDPEGPPPDWKTVSAWRGDDPYHCNVFHGRPYVERVWGAFFEVAAVRPLSTGAQAAVVCRKPS